MRVLVVCMLVAIGFAGCADAPVEESVDETFDDVEVEVSDTTGAILGVVVDDTITPIEGAKVVLMAQGLEMNQTTDAQGRFAYSNLPAGSYFMKVSKSLHESVQSSATVVAGVQKPDVVRIQLPRLYQVQSEMIAIKHDGFFQCSQNGASLQYSSSPCYSTNPQIIPDGTFVEEREWHEDVPAGWVAQVFEMTWKQSLVGTGENMGLVVSTYKPERSGTHSYANVASSNPMHFRLDVGVTHETANQGGGPEGPIPADGMEDMSFFASVRRSSVLPAIAIEQEFTVYLHQFVACEPQEGWSVLEGSENPC